MRLDQKHRDHANDRRIGFIAPRSLPRLRRSPVRDRRRRRFVVLQDVGRFVGGAVIFDQRLANFLRTGADQLDLALQQKTEAVDRVDIERIADGDDQAGLAEADRDDFEAARVFAAGFD